LSPGFVRKLLAFSFPLGAVGHFWWVGQHGLLYHGPAPAWAVWFWYCLCATDFMVCWLLLTQPRPGLALAVAVMAISLAVNWVCFPTFEHGFNGVLVGLTGFGLLVFCTAPWLWRSIDRPVRSQQIG
jgi:hypothetical protein